jgi:hypothetical protein
MTWEPPKDPDKIVVDDEIDVRAAYADKVSEHAELIADKWLGDWEGFFDQIAKKAGITRQEAMLYVQGLYLKDIAKMLNQELPYISYHIGWMHAERHSDDPKLNGDRCPVRENVEQQEADAWKEGT